MFENDLLRNGCESTNVMKLYEPNEDINMLGIRMELMNNYIRIFTAHLKQASKNSREIIEVQFDEIKKQFRQAEVMNELMIAIMDVNVHVGNEGIKGCKDNQDWCGKRMLEIISEEKLILINDTNKCSGIVTRVDPRNGKESSIDLAICNQKTFDVVIEMEIDEEELFKPRCYKSGKVTKTDHHAMFINLKIKRQRRKKEEYIMDKKNEESLEKYKQIVESSNINEMFIDDSNDLDVEYGVFMSEMNSIMKASFKMVKPNSKLKKGIDEEIKKLIGEERRIRREVKENPQRGKQIFEIQKRIGETISRKKCKKISEKVEEIIKAKYPPAKVFQIRRNYKRVEQTAFPLKDSKGKIRMEKNEIDEIIDTHLRKVFNQNPVPEGKLWNEYWTYVEKVYKKIQKYCTLSRQMHYPTYEEIGKIIKDLRNNKTVGGDLTIDMVKAGGKSLGMLIHRIIKKCITIEQIPKQMREEKMPLIHKKGDLMEIDNYRGIFLREVILSIMQKWLFNESSPVVEQKGSDFAFGGRKGKSTRQALLIIRLIQDHAEWTESNIVLKFLDIEKFFDSMNYKKALIMAFCSGLEGNIWTMYDIINKNKICEPITSMGKGKRLEIEEIFVQGSSDAVIMAWNLMDWMNKKEEDIFDEIIVIEGVPMNRLLFVDDVVEVSKSMESTDVNNITHGVFQNENRIKYKTSKCKIMMNREEDNEFKITMNNEEMERKVSHTYLGTIISEKGRKEELERRLKMSNGVVNEIVEICKRTELSPRMRYIKILTNACVDMKLKYGCEFWDCLNKKQVEEVNKIKINMMDIRSAIFYSVTSNPT